LRSGDLISGMKREIVLNALRNLPAINHFLLY
jgi:hypothetical protein